MKTTSAASAAAGREAFARRAWADAFELLSSADEREQLPPDDLELLALAAYSLNRDVECAKAWTRAHHEWVRRGERRRAARSAFLQACSLFAKGEMAPAGGWIARARRLLDECDDDCPERGWLVQMSGLPLMFQGDDAAALPYFIDANDIAERFPEDKELLAMSRLTRGHCLIRTRQMAEGLALIDEAMVAVTSGEVNPLVTGIVYCQVIGTCQTILDVRRAREWTESLSRWCDSQPDLVPYRGDCLIYRSELLRLQGAWADATAAAGQACDAYTAQRAWGLLGSAYYQVGEVHRLRGDLASAEAEYSRASQAGYDPQPGISQLRLAQGRLDAAVAGIVRFLAEKQLPIDRARVLPPYVEIHLAANDVDAAEAAARELSAIAEEADTQFLHAASACATGAVMLSRGNPREALIPLRAACRGFQELDAPYEASRTRVLIALACRALGDEDAALRDLASARAAFARLGASPDVARIDGLSAPPAAAPAGLTMRELEVLVLVAKGKTNRQISEELVLSENTVARHLQNIFSKLGVSSRTAASAFAFENRLV